MNRLKPSQPDIVLNFDVLKAQHEAARAGGAGRRPWIDFATTMMDSFPRLYETAKRMNSRQAELEQALRDLVAQIELHADDKDGRLSRSVLNVQIEAAERLVGTWPEFARPAGSAAQEKTDVAT